MGRESLRRMPRAFVVDCALSFAVAVSTVLTSVIAGGRAEQGPPDWVGHLLLVVAAAFLVARRRYPPLVMVLTMLVSLVYFGLGFGTGAFTIAPALAVYTAITAKHRIAGFAGAAVYLVIVLLADSSRGPQDVSEGHVWLVIWILVIVVAGEVSRSRAEHLRMIAEQAARAELTREMEAQRRADQERLRIARELHDVLAHNISVISIQAGVAEHLLRRDPDKAHAAVTTIKRVTKDVLVELRSILDVLRRVDEAGEIFPPSGIEDIERLAGMAAAGGITVDLDVRGQASRVPADVGLAAYRVVQESLTNVIRHSGAAHASVVVHVNEADVLVRVRDDGRGASGDDVRAGNGIAGMTERVRAMSGTITAAPADGRGFVVEAWLPLRRPEP
ncbi:sensor histidine kinase [Microbispora hainanensis]|uniref:histidine kinase n=1 Tax=Microbispora hainanensis TaxID=568844 RepID=A0ABZ1SRZ2_9ACTN|nr:MULTISPECIES: sensor histidine kinase [Microbispora]